MDSKPIRNAMALGLTPEEFLDDNDRYHFFRKPETYPSPGPTGINVMDLRIMMVKKGLKAGDGRMKPDYAHVLSGVIRRFLKPENSIA